MQVERKQRALFGLKDWWGDNKTSLTAMAMAVAPPLLVSTSVPDAFATATDIAVSELLFAYYPNNNTAYYIHVWHHLLVSIKPNAPWMI